MKISIISDTHFGDPMCALVRKEGNKYVIGKKYDDFKNTIGAGIDYLVMLGDIFDFSIVSYEEAYEAGKVFFNQLKTDKITEKIVFVPGNHDSDFWQTVEYEVNIINQIGNNKPPRKFRWSVPGVFDFRSESKDKDFNLPEVSSNKEGNRYGGLFLDGITQGLTFYVAYPNIYMLTNEDSILLTHGQYLEMFWCMASEWVMKIAQKDLEIGGALDIKEMVAINFPLSQLSCSGVGQAGPLTGLVRKVQREVKDHQFDRVERYLNNLDIEIDKRTNYPWYKSHKEWSTDLVSNKAKEYILNTIKDSKSTRYDKEFIHSKEVQNRFSTFYKACLVELDDLNNNYNLKISPPNKVIFGHTHEPIGWNSKMQPKTTIGNQTVRLFNTGGWLYRNVNGTEEFVGAEIFIFEEQKGICSFSI